MIYSEDFIWLHFPKCAGTKIEHLAKNYLSDEPGLYQDPVGRELDPSIKWHDSIASRQQRDPNFSVEGKTIICSFRKLPSWLESRYNFDHHDADKTNPNWPNIPELLLQGEFFWASGPKSHADKVCRYYLPAELMETGKVKFLRMEFFKNDFQSIFSEFVDISKIPDSEYEKRANKSTSYLPKDIKEKLYENTEGLHKKCPYWKRIEDIAYG